MIYSIFMGALIIVLKIMGSMLDSGKNFPSSKCLLINNMA